MEKMEKGVILPSSRVVVEKVVANLKSGLLVVDSTGKVVILNRAAQAILRLPPLPPAGRKCATLLADHPYLSELILASFGRSTLPDRAELEISGGRGKPKRVIGYTLSPVLSDSGERIGAALFFKDLTVVEREESKAVMMDRLATMGKMAAWLAHEIRNPLAAIGVNAGLLAKDETDPLRHDLTRDILREVRRLNGIITQTLDFVRPRPLNLQECDLARLLREVVEAQAAAATGVSVHWSLGRLPVALLDEHQLRNAFQNLVKNCCEAMPVGGELRVRARLVASEGGGQVPEAFTGQVERDERNIQVEIEDNGSGMSPEVLEKVFTPFYTTKPGGTGVGMSIAQKYIADHWGFLDIRSRPGKGTRFSVTLPLYRRKESREEG